MYRSLADCLILKVLALLIFINLRIERCFENNIKFVSFNKKLNEHEIIGIFVYKEHLLFTQSKPDLLQITQWSFKEECPGVEVVLSCYWINQ